MAAKVYMTRMRKKLQKKSAMEEEDTPKLPYDIIENILSRLPVKSLVRFKSVSKPWNSLISGTEFVKIHLRESLMHSDFQTHFLLNTTCTFRSFCLVRLATDRFRVETEIDFPLKKYRQAVALCSSNGLLLLKNDRLADKMYILWNPSIRTYQKFSCPYPIDLETTTYGICYDSSNGDYKVVLVTTGFYAVFSNKNNSWTKESATMYVSMDPGVFVNGALHWVAIEDCILNDVRATGCNKCSDVDFVNSSLFNCTCSYKREIYYFDSQADKFEKFPKPKCLEDSFNFNLTSLRGNLCLYRNTLDLCLCSNKYDVLKIEIWMMKTYGDCNSWMKLLTVENIPIYPLLEYAKPLYLNNKSEVVLHIAGNWFAVYCPKEKKFRDYDFYDEIKRQYPNTVSVLRPVFFMDTLVIPTRVKVTKRKRNGHSET